MDGYWDVVKLSRMQGMHEHDLELMFELLDLDASFVENQSDFKTDYTQVLKTALRFNYADDLVQSDSTREFVPQCLKVKLGSYPQIGINVLLDG